MTSKYQGTKAVLTIGSQKIYSLSAEIYTAKLLNNLYILHKIKQR